tara:strand:- start:1863 stop:2156 length:294 start_codon:yes stop_codon:yes gene_type:complete
MESYNIMDIPTGLIRKVIVMAGDRDITYVRGNSIARGTIKIVDITFDQAYSMQYNKPRYNIYVQEINSEFTRLWKSIPGDYCLPEYETGIETIEDND